MKNWGRIAAACALSLLFAGSCSADVFASTEALGYSGTWTRYATLANAQTGTNPIGNGTVPQHDLTVFVSQGFGSVGVPDSVNFLTRFYSTVNGMGAPVIPPGYPQNTLGGFVQIGDTNGNTATSVTGFFVNDTSMYRLQVTGANAGAADTARFGEVNTGTINDSAGTWISYGFDLTVRNLTGFNPNLPGFPGLFGGFYPQPGGLGTTIPNVSGTGTFNGIFQNTGPDASRNGFYVVNLGINNNSFANGQGLLDNTRTESFASGRIAPPADIPEPMSLAVFGALAVGAIGVARRRMRAA